MPVGRKVRSSKKLQFPLLVKSAGEDASHGISLRLGCPPGSRVWLTSGLLPVGCRDEAWLKKGLPCS